MLHKPTDTISLEDHNTEFAVLGTMLAFPEIVPEHIDTLKPEHFTQPEARAILSAIAAAHKNGSVTSYAVMANLPDVDGSKAIPGRIVSSIMDFATTAGAVEGLKVVLVDRWCRREAFAVSGRVSGHSGNIDVSPRDLAVDMLEAADGILSAQGDNDASMFDDGAESFVSDLESGQTVRQVTTGLRDLDEKVGGYRPGQFYVLAGRPAMGKSALGISTMAKVAASGANVMLFSMEMPRDEVIARMLADHWDDPHAPFYGKIMNRTLTREQMADLRMIKDSISGLPIFIDYSATHTVDDIASSARRHKAKLAAQGKSLDVIYVDHLTTIAPRDRYRGNPVMEVSDNVESLRRLAKQLDVAIVCLCQLSRDVEKRDDKRPMLSDLRWTGEIEQAAHVVAFIFREEYYLKSDPKADRYDLMNARNKMELLIRKNRQGETGDISLYCDMAFSRVRDKPRAAE